ncbi:hypothetical protein FDUTEX481_05111 [Tolypothrix sp. PCC 7601]|nr:hypothetical protein FDUTEX481_05111 [Tolypothrix sp. PCC 7601]
MSQSPLPLIPRGGPEFPNPQSPIPITPEGAPSSPIPSPQSPVPNPFAQLNCS